MFPEILWWRASASGWVMNVWDCVGETGPNHRPMRVEWVDEIFEECRKAGVPFFFKQYAGPRQGWKRDYRGRIWQEYPAQAKKTRAC